MMRPGRITGRATPKGVAFLVTLIFVALFTCAALALVTMADTNMAISRDRLHMNQSSSLAETGLVLAQRQLGGLAVSGDTAASVHNQIADHFRTAWANSAMVNAAAITADANAVVLPAIWLPRADGLAGTIELVITADGGAHEDGCIVIQSTGRFAGAVRTAYYDLGFENAMTAINAYAIATRSTIVMTDNATIQGANNDQEGSILSATTSVACAIDMSDTARISGDAAAANPDANISTIGDATIGGDRITGADEPEWPTIETAGFQQYVEEVVAGDVSDATLHNIRIPAGTNPTFSGNVNIYGVLYVESPNTVTFTGNTNICGIVVAEEPVAQDLQVNQIRFNGNLTTSGVQNLPDRSRYDGLRQATGSFLLAPGYTVRFSNTFNTINGCMAAGKFVFRGNAAGTVGGAILNLDDSLVRLKDNANLLIDRTAANPNPAGLSGGYSLVCVRGSYRE